jgi:hypothetical protein
MSSVPSGSHRLQVLSFLMKQQSMVNVTMQFCKISSSLYYDSYWMMSSQTSRLVELNHFLGHLIPVIWPHSTTFYKVLLKQVCIHQNHILWPNKWAATEECFQQVRVLVWTMRPTRWWLCWRLIIWTVLS